jgi:phage tail sheath protein FI
MTRFIRSSTLAAVLLAAAPVWAQVYKWVDDKGVVNYSSQPPANRKSALLDPNSVSVSTYTPEDTPTRAETNASVRMLTERIASLERKLEAERYTRQNLAEAQTTALERRHEQCLRDRRIDCDHAGIDPYYAPYGPTVVVFRPRLRTRPFVPARSALIFTPKPSRLMFAPTRASRPGSPTM